jgi:cell division protein FtsL
VGRAGNGNRKLRSPRVKRPGLWIAAIALVFMETLFYAWCRVQCVNTGYAIEQANGRRASLLAERSTLNIELARLKSPERIETIARARLGLTMPDSRQTMTLP